jgi:hypothetical protein
MAGLLAAAVLGLLTSWIFPGTPAPYLVGVPIAGVTLAVSMMLLVGGKKLKARGIAAERATRERAIRALAANNGGVVTALQVSAAHKMREEDADALLTELARAGAGVTLDVSDDGELSYRFLPESLTAQDRWRRPAVRVDAPAARVGRVDSPAKAEAADVEFDDAEIEAASAPRPAARRGVAR